jgi:muconolactone delta-isomerase
MEFLVEFDIHVPAGTPEAEIEQRERSEAAAAADLARAGHFLRLWKGHLAPSQPRTFGLYNADTESQLRGLLDALPLRDWMEIKITALEPHPNDPASARSDGFRLPDPLLTPVYRLEATVGSPLDLGDVPLGHRRVVPLTGGTFSGPQIVGTLVPGVSADWQTVLPDGTALGDIRYTLQLAAGGLLAVRSDSVRHGPPEVLARLARGEDVHPAEYTFRTSTRIETTVPGLEWMNKGVFLSVGGRSAGGVVYETYLVG